eukprot:gene10829-12039_t
MEGRKSQEDEISKGNEKEVPSFTSHALDDDYTYAYALLSLGSAIFEDRSSRVTDLSRSTSPPSCNSSVSSSTISQAAAFTHSQSFTEGSATNRKRLSADLRAYSLDSVDQQRSGNKKLARGKYKCSHCGEPKINHVCTVINEDTFSFSSVYIQTEQASIDLSTGILSLPF